MDIQIREATTEEELRAIYRLRYRVYVEELNLAPALADHDRKLLAEPTDAHAHNFYAAAGDEVVGALRGLLRKEGPLEHEALYDLEQFRPFYPDAVSMTTKLVVLPGRRAGAVLRLLVLAAYQFGRRHGVQFDFLDCWPHLINLYEHLGYRRYKSNVNHPEAGYMTPMVLVLEDVDHLRRIGSPLAEAAEGLPSSREAAELFAARFPDFARAKPRRLLSPEELWALLSEKVSGRPAEAVPLFRGMAQEEIQAVLAAGNLITCRTGDRIITQGEARQEFYTLLTGRAEASLEVEGRRQSLGTMAAGDTFGEMASLAGCARTADVIALEGCELLVHDAGRLGALEQRDARLAAKLYHNLARILAFRLVQTNLLPRGRA